jgi:hypothetical protein
MRIALVPVPKKVYKSGPGGTFNLAAWRSYMDRWRPYAKMLEDYHARGVLIGLYLIDEPECIRCNGGRAISQETVLGLGAYAKQIAPSVTTMARVWPEWFNGYDPRGKIDVAWAQYASQHREGRGAMTPEQYRDRNVQAAKRLGLGLVMAMNLLNGGTGASGLRGPSHYARGGQYHWQMTADDIRRAGSVFAADPYVCAVLSWAYSADYQATDLSPSHLASVRQFSLRPDIQAAMRDVRRVADQHPPRDCRP